MKWFLRFILWTALLALPAYWLAGAYQQALLGAVAFALGLHVRDGLRPATLDLSAANSLVVFAALCLASTHTKWRRRVIALLAGLVALVAIEWIVGLLSVAAAIQQTRDGAWSALSSRTWSELTELQHWVTAPVVWLLLLGHRELPALRAVGTRGPAVRSGPSSSSGE